MGCAIEIVKLVLFIFNLVFALCGLGLLTVGVMYKLQMDDLDNILSETSLSVAPTLLIVVGAVIFVISFFGCCGTIRENHCMVATYATILLSLLIIQIAVGVYVYMGSNGHEKADDLIQKTVRNVFAKYKDDPEAKNTFDVAQSAMHCCGINGPSDYLLMHQMVVLPTSCCFDQHSSCPVIPLNINAKYYTDGCLEKLENLAKSIGTVLSIVLMAIVGVEVVGIIFALCLANSIKNSQRRMGV